MNNNEAVGRIRFMLDVGGSDGFTSADQEALNMAINALSAEITEHPKMNTAKIAKLCNEIDDIATEIRERTMSDSYFLAQKIIDNSRQITAEITAPPKTNAEPEVRHGRWKKKNGEIYCTNCKKSRWSESFELLLHGFSFCPKCGARMDGGADNGRTETEIA